MGKSTNVEFVALAVTCLLALIARIDANPVAAFGFATRACLPGQGSPLQNDASLCTRVGGMHVFAAG